ncbi:MAG: FtsK/SpoIIIE domain-containing protein [Actinomycetota bacterium]|nr:FtsK/SpoIIIE domain-containing protein [Actinomycetota bacterium]
MPSPHADHRRPFPSTDGLFLLEDIITGLVRLLWAYRLELATVTFFNVALQFGSVALGPEATMVALVLLVAAVVGVSTVRHAAVGIFHAAHVRRLWRRACLRMGVVTNDERVPRARKVRRAPSGDVVSVTLPKGLHSGDVDACTEGLACCLRLREVRVAREAEDASRCVVSLVRRDTLAGAEPLPWPHREAEALSLWQPIPVGVDENGEVITVSLPERNVLLGGEPGAGKSVALSLMVATAALDPACRLWLLDGKLVELAAWRGCAHRSVGVSVAEANGVLCELQDEMDARYEQLLGSRRRKVSAGDPWPLEVVVCDELAHYLSATDRKVRAEFSERMRDLVARGRAAGVIVLAATQKPSHDVIPTSLRDLFGFRWALRCSTPQASDTVLGQTWASNGFSAADIDAGARGVGFLLHEGLQPVRLKSFHLSDEDLDQIALRAELLRATCQEKAEA